MVAGGAWPIAAVGILVTLVLGLVPYFLRKKDALVPEIPQMERRMNRLEDQVDNLGSRLDKHLDDHK